MPVGPFQAPEERLSQRADRLTVVAVSETIRSAPGLAKLLAKDTSVPLVSCSGNGQEVIAICQQVNPCVLIAEMSFIANTDLGVLSGNDGSRSWIKLLAIVDQDDPALCKRLLRMGCSGAVPRTATPAVYRRALRALADGELWASRAILAALLRELLLHDQPKRLTEREEEILALIANGYQNRRIAETLFISRETVRWHVRAIYKKLGVRDRNEAVAHGRAARDFSPTKPVQKAAAASNLVKSPTVQG